MDDDGGPSDIAARDQAVADASRRFLEVVLDNSATKAVLTWGLSDRFLKSSGWRETLSGYSPRTLPLDAGPAADADVARDGAGACDGVKVSLKILA